MRFLLVVAASVPFLAACEAMNQKVETSQQDRCQRANWALVGERDGRDGYSGMAQRYDHICGPLFNKEVYQEALKKGLAQRPTPPV